MKTKLFTLLLAVAASVGTIFSVNINGLNYTLDSSAKTAEVAMGNTVSGPIEIPSSVIYNNITYSVTSIGNLAFRYSSSLTSVTIPNSVTSIGNYAFFGCASLTSVTIGPNVTNIGTEAFGSTIITTINFTGTITNWCNKTWYPSNISNNYQLQINGLLQENITIPSNVTSLSYTFSGCRSLKSVTIQNSVTTIGDWTFSNCSNLASVSIGNSVSNIGNWAFIGCSSLTFFAINTINPPTLGSNVFSGVTLSSCKLYVPEESMTSYMGANGWSDFGSFMATEINGSCGDNLTWTLNFINGTLSISGTGEMTDWSNLLTIPWYNHRAYIKSLILNYGMTSIGRSAFNGCSEIQTVSIPSSVTSIGSYAFYDCSNLSSINITNNVTSIGSYAFRYCSKLTSIVIPKKVVSIEDYTFQNCSGLTYVYIQNSVTNIGAGAFKDCTGVTSISIPNSVTSIGNGAFDNVPNIIYNGTATGSPWGAKSLNGYVDGWLVYSDNTKTNLIACSSLASGEIILPNSITSIGASIFYNCRNITSVTIPNSVTSIGNNAFSGCTSLTSVEIPNSVTSIGSGAFSKCSNITSVVIPNSVTSIGAEAFSYCSSLTNAEIGNSVTSIMNSAFFGCGNLTSIIIGSSVTSIGKNVFYSCSNLKNLTNYAVTPQTIKANVFEGVDKSACTLYVRKSSIELYKEANIWKEFENIEKTHNLIWNVTFLDYNNSILSEQEVEDGEAAIAPTNPTREGYTFTDWDKNFSNVTEDMTVIAQYKINRYFVQFLDWDDTVLKADSVDYGSAAIAPTDPTREGYTFMGWDKDFSSITENLDIQAVYVYNDDPTNAPEVYTNPANSAQKLIRNGNVYILRGEKVYTVTGQEVR